MISFLLDKGANLEALTNPRNDIGGHTALFSIVYGLCSNSLETDGKNNFYHTIFQRLNDAAANAKTLRFAGRDEKALEYMLALSNIGLLDAACLNNAIDKFYRE